MSQSARQKREPEAEPVRVLGRGLRAQRGVHLTLRTLREAAGKTQVEVAQASQIDQADISRLESRTDFDDCQVATLGRYVAALGGRLEVVAEFGDKKISLVGVAPVALSTVPANGVAFSRRRSARAKRTRGDRR
ncbi:MAG: XRE family transcriptional regulator [Polyangiaceae bacterium]|nr:XRE family transcriptional regulator [Polyangiaceae bacterium]